LGEGHWVGRDGLLVRAHVLGLGAAGRGEAWIEGL
jgi:hypothetical protein